MEPQLVARQARSYYAGPSNAFWSTLYDVGLTPRLLRPVEFRELGSPRLPCGGTLRRLVVRFRFRVNSRARTRLVFAA